VLPTEPTRMEARFLAEQNITRINLPLAQFAPTLTLFGHMFGKIPMNSMV